MHAYTSIAGFSPSMLCRLTVGCCRKDPESVEPDPRYANRQESQLPLSSSGRQPGEACRLSLPHQAAAAAAATSC